MCVCVCVCVLCCLMRGHTSMHMHMQGMVVNFSYITIATSYFCLGCLRQQQQQRWICPSKRSEKNNNGDHHDCTLFTMKDCTEEEQSAVSNPLPLPSKTI